MVGMMLVAKAFDEETIYTLPPPSRTASIGKDCKGADISISRLFGR
jgi:hypothetical protein